MTARPLRRPPEAAPKEDTATRQCSFCTEKPSGRMGHAGLALRAHNIPPTIRTHVRLKCAFCGTNWARRRVSAKTFEWCRIAD